TASDDVSYHRLTADAARLDARPVSLIVPLAQNHAAGSPVTERGRLIAVHALDAGVWGDRLRISVEDEPAGLLVKTNLTSVVTTTQIRLASSSGVQSGTILELLNPATGTTVGDAVKVSAIDRANNIILLNPGLSAAQVAAIAALPPGSFMGARSREFSLTVRLLR